MPHLYSPPVSPRHRSRRALLAIFVLSGFAGLIYQSIWSHYLGLFLGHAAYAQALVLAIFMGGMALGAAWVGHAGQRWRNLVRAYALIEAIIGCLGLLFHGIFTGVAALSYDWLIPALGAPWAIDVARWTVAALLILPQTILLGMTFPLMSGGLMRRYPARAGRLLGGLYFTNSIGAAIGALVAVFILLPWVGLPGAMGVAGILNFGVAALAWWLAREPEPEPEHAINLAAGTTTTSSTASTTNGATGSATGTNPAALKALPEQRLLHNPLLRLVLFGTALSGAASFVYEIVWIRLLSMAVGSTLHAFELMLASFILGIALGGLWVRNHADATASPLRLVGWMQLGMGVAALASLAVYANAFGWVGALIDALAKTDGGYALFNAGTAAIAIAIMLPAAFFAGTTLPLFTVALLRQNLGERAIGRVYAWNTVGAIGGIFAAIHYLIPTHGLKWALCAAAVVDIGIGLVLLRPQTQHHRSMAAFAAAVGMAALALLVAVQVPFDPMTLASGVYRNGNSLIDPDDRMRFYRDGKTASISVIEAPEGDVIIATNGKPDAALMLGKNPPTNDEPTMMLAAALPLSMQAAPQRVGVIGFGSGLTTHTLLGDTRLARVDTIEIEEAMVQGARVFGHRVARAYTDPRSHIVIDDAKAYFSGQQAQYDIIISEPSNPWVSGVSALFSKEFYQFVPRHLNANGLFVQWVQLYETNDALVGSILKTLTPAFADYAAWASNSGDLLIVASPKGQVPKIDFTRLQRSPALQQELAAIGITSPAILQFRQVANAAMLRGLSKIHPSPAANSDFYPTLGLQAPQARFKGLSAESVMMLPYLHGELLQALGVRTPLSAATPPSHLEHFPAEGATWRARVLAAQLRGDSRALVPMVVVLKALAGACDAPLPQTSLHLLPAKMVEMAELTIPFLPPQELQGVWIQPQWPQCKHLPQGYAAALKLLQARAQRDYAAMETLGRSWLHNPPDDPYLRRDFGPVALSGLLLSLAHAGRWQDVQHALETFGPSVPASDAQLFQRTLLHSMAQP
ncbi:MAG: fused MFS/spermidine synthase [Burkholderiales bacterium]|nr:fused MFS/spermidine synthase [Burkholderiales bacterium]